MNQLIGIELRSADHDCLSLIAQIDRQPNDADDSTIQRASIAVNSSPGASSTSAAVVAACDGNNPFETGIHYQLSGVAREHNGRSLLV